MANPPASNPPESASWKQRAADFWQHLEATGQQGPLLVLVGLSAVLFWAYGNSLAIVVSRWDDPLYSHGYVVPLFAIALLWMRREPLSWSTSGARWAGLALLAGGLVMRLVSTRMGVVTSELVSFVPCLAGVFLLVGGWRLIRWAGPAIVFLLFMFPMPDFVKRNILERLQNIATIASTFVLQTLGVAAYSEGNRITVGEMQMGVVDACSGLRMATNLLALVVAIVLITNRPWWERLIVLLSAIPIALTVNIVRITATGLFHVWRGPEELGDAFHDWAGFLMMPLALGLLFLELEVLSRLVLDVEDGKEMAAAGIGIRPAPGAKPKPSPTNSTS